MKNDIFFVYETTNLINGKKYRGIHKTKNLNDGYIGSGIVFENAVKKYCKENFQRKILEFCNSYEELLEKEKFYVDINWVKDKNNYNIKTGGQSSGILSDESKNKISETLKKRYKNGEIVASIGDFRRGKAPWNKGLNMSDKFKEKCSKSGKKRYKDDENHSLKLFGSKTVTEKTKNKISNTLKERYKTERHPSKGEPSKKKGQRVLQVPWNKGLIGLKGHKFKKEKNFECPHCGRFFDKVNAKRWHFENCKFKTSS